MERAACYLRVSTDDQTIECQRSEVETLAQARGFEPVWYEESESAAKRRPVFEQMMLDARKGKVRAVIVWRLDRLHRSLLGAVRDVLELDRVGAPVISVHEDWLDTAGPARPLLVAVFGWVAEQEREAIRQRTRAGLELARKRGVHLGRPSTSGIMLAVGADAVASGRSIRRSARMAGVSEASLRRHLRARQARAAVENVPGPGPSH